MDFNNIKERWEDMTQSLQSRYHLNIEDGINFNKYPDGYYLDFNKRNIKEFRFKVETVISSLANLKDILIKCVKDKGLQKSIVEYKINNSIYLSVLIDLNNSYKHGYPLTRSQRSHKQPKITAIRESLLLSTSSQPNSVASITINPNNELTIQGNTKLIISAVITDQKGKVLFSLDELIDKSIEGWQSIIEENNLLEEN